MQAAVGGVATRGEDVGLGESAEREHGEGQKVFEDTKRNSRCASKAAERCLCVA